MRAFSSPDRLPADRALLALDLVRIFLGIGLFVRGVVFIMQPSAFYGLLDMADPAFSAALLAHYVALAHLAGGLLLALGLLTRIAALVQIPVLLGAVLFVHLGDGLASPGQSFEFAALVLVLLGVFAVVGSGPLSVDAKVVERREEDDATISPLLRRLRAESLERDRPAPSAEPVAVGCTCEGTRNRHSPDVKVEREYGLGGSLRFLTGTTGEPRRIVFRCRECGEIVETSERPEDLAYYRYREENRRPQLRRREA